MKKKIFIIVLTAILAAVLATGIYFTVRSTLPDNSGGAAFTLVLRDSAGADTVYRIDTEKSTLFEALLEQKEKGIFTLKYTGSGENIMLSEVGRLDSALYEKGWLALYTSIKADDARSSVPLSDASWGTAVYSGQTLNSATLGAARMPVYQDVIYLIELKENY